MNLIDSHCHLDDSRFLGETDAVLARMKEAGVNRCILAGSDMPSSQAVAHMAAKYPQVYGMVGVHPHEAKGFQPEDLERMNEWLQKEKIVGVGEIGLDYFYDLSPRNTQKEALVAQLLFAREKGVPVAFHVRDAHGDMIDVLRAHKAELPQGVLHCFSGSVESARQYLDMGFYLSFAGPVTFKNAVKLQEVAKFCPADRLLVETDSPYLAPVPMRGKRNEPAYVSYVAKVLALLRGVTEEELADTATENTCRLYGIAS